MSREKNLVKNTIIITIGKVCTQLITFILLPLYTSILTVEEYGIVDVLNTLVALMLPIVTLQIEQAVFRELIECRDNEDKKKKVVSSGVISVIFQCLIYVIIFIIIFPIIKNDYKIFLATNVITYIFLSLFQQIARGMGENKKFSIASFITAIFTIVFNLLFLLVIKLGANGMLIGTMLGQVFGTVYLFLTLKLYKYISLKTYKKDILKQLFKYSMPLIPNAICWWVFNASDRIIVTSFLGVGENGILAASLKFSTLYITLYNIFNMSWTESISLNINDSDFESYFNNTFKIVLNLFITLAIGLISVMPFLYPLLINEKFSAGYGLIPIAIIGSLFNVIVGLISVIYVAKKNTKAIANTSIVAAICNIAIHIALIKFIGLYAAVVSTLASFFIMSIYRIYDINKKYIKIKISGKLIFVSCITLFIILVCYYSSNLYLYITALVIALVYAWCINKNSIYKIVHFLNSKLGGKKKD